MNDFLPLDKVAVLERFGDSDVQALAREVLHYRNQSVLPPLTWNQIYDLQELFYKWLRIRTENGYLKEPTMADIVKSRLLGWMLQGNDPFDIPPPCIVSAGWYELIRDGKDTLDFFDDSTPIRIVSDIVLQHNTSRLDLEAGHTYVSIEGNVDWVLIEHDSITDTWLLHRWDRQHKCLVANEVWRITRHRREPPVKYRTSEYYEIELVK